MQIQHYQEYAQKGRGQNFTEFALSLPYLPQEGLHCGKESKSHIFLVNNLISFQGMVFSIRCCLSEIRIQLFGKLEKHLKLVTAEVLSLSVSVVKVRIPPPDKNWCEAAADLCVYTELLILGSSYFCASSPLWQQTVKQAWH